MLWPAFKITSEEPIPAGTVSEPPREANKPMFLKDPNNRAGVAAALTIAWALLMGWAANQYPFPHIFHHDIGAPVLALELSSDGPEIDTVLHRSEKEKTARAVDTMR